MSNIPRLLTTMFVWGATTALGIAAMAGSSNIDGFTVFAIIAVLSFMATVATWGVWQGASSSISMAAREQGAQEKSKRSSRERLLATLNALDEDEAADALRDIRTRLAEGSRRSDGELEPLDALLRDQRRA